MNILKEIIGGILIWVLFSIFWLGLGWLLLLAVHGRYLEALLWTVVVSLAGWGLSRLA